MHCLATTNAHTIARSDAEPAGRPAELSRGRSRAAALPGETGAAESHPLRAEPAAAAARPADAAQHRPVSAEDETAADQRRRRGAPRGERG